jgi:DtxR family Mn-dependent transcriptional regulator
MKTGERFGRSAEMYLKTIAELGDFLDLVPISSVAERLEISPVSATEMIHRMQRKELVKHEPYRGVKLTETGRKLARDILRRHRLWERFLVDVLELPWEDVHDLACDLEHAADSAVTDALDEFLGHPESCPHGNPISVQRSTDAPSPDSGLDQLAIGMNARVSRIREESSPVLRSLAARGIRPGFRVRVRDIEPLDGPRSIDIGEGASTLGSRLASHVIIEPIAADDIEEEDQIE